MNLTEFEQTLKQNLNIEKAKDVNVKINVTVLNGSSGKFNVTVENNDVNVREGKLDDAHITVGFTTEESLNKMFLEGANPVSLVMSGKMTFNGDMNKGKSLKGLFIK